MTLTKSERGRLGAHALNSDPEKKSEAQEKATRTNLTRNPNYYREIGKLGGKSRKSVKK